MVKNIIERICADCNGTEFISDYSAGDIVCKKCGLVLIGRIIETSGSPVYNNDDNGRARNGPALNNLKADYGLSTEIGSANTDAWCKDFICK